MKNETKEEFEKRISEKKKTKRHYIKSFSSDEIDAFALMVENIKHIRNGNFIACYDFYNNKNFESLVEKMKIYFGEKKQKAKLAEIHQNKEKNSIIKIKEVIEKLKNENIKITASKLIEETKLNKNTIYKFYDVKSKNIKEEYLK